MEISFSNSYDTYIMEGKTTVSIGLSQAFNKLGHSCIVALREPSLGPVLD